MQELDNFIYNPGENCWFLSQASHVSILIDYANYYEALYQSLNKAKRSIFILGWDIDSRIELLRGSDIKEGDSVTCFDVICERAHKNPELQIYLNKWDYSYFFMKQREPQWKHKWNKCGLPNIHVCLDSVVPFGACHHQKIVVIDDEIFFWGGMDVALGRWDRRQHYPENFFRVDPSGLPDPEKKHKFGPYHDIQAVAAGPAVKPVAAWVRHRWKQASDVEPVPLVTGTSSSLPPSWPQKFPPQFENVSIATARTLPALPKGRETKEVLRMFLDEIAQAESFIYIENQYLTYKPIAEAINRRLIEKPELRLLAVSCKKPQGMMERKVMWAGRLQFQDIARRGLPAGKFAIAYPISQKDGKEDSVHIHSKIMIVDDKFLHLGSSNICNRSMGLDTEFDVTLIGSDDETRQGIAAIRNDLLREHCGREVPDIQNIIDGGLPVSVFFEDVETSRQHLRRTDDEQYRHEKFVAPARLLGDPHRPYIPYFRPLKWIRRYKAFTLLPAVLLLLAALSLIWIYSPLSRYASIEGAAALLRDVAASPFSFIYALGLYTIGGILFFPITVMTAAAVIVFGPLKGVCISFLGAILSGIAAWGAGRLAGEKWLSRTFGSKVLKITDKIRGIGIGGVALIRVVPIAPYPLVNMVFGAANITILSFVVGTILGLAPGKLALALTGEGILKIIESPSLVNIGYLVAGLTLWAAVIFASHKLGQKMQKGKAAVI